MVQRENNVVYQNINDEGNTYFMVTWKGKINHVHGKKRKKIPITDMIFTDCSTTLPGETAYNKIHQSDGRVDPPKTIFHPRV